MTINRVTMKKILSFCFLMFVLGTKAQDVNYTSIREVITESFPEIDFSNKLLAISVWNADNKESRDQNKEYYRAYQTYQNAKLKGGLKGVVFISISSDQVKTLYDITKQKDLGLYNYALCDFNSYNQNGKLNRMGIKKEQTNLVFDSNGNLVYQNLTTDIIFKSFNLLITR